MAARVAQQRLERARVRAELQKSQVSSPVSSSAIGGFHAPSGAVGESPGRAARAEAERVARERVVASSAARGYQFEPRRAAKGRAGHLNSFEDCAEWNCTCRVGARSHCAPHTAHLSLPCACPALA